MKNKIKKCKRCGYEWIPLKPNPKVCPACKSYKWQEESKFKKEVT